MTRYHIDRFNELLEGTVEGTVQHHGDIYVITSGTGDGTFAYHLDDFVSGVRAMEEAEDRYQAFCDATIPEDEDRELAVKVYREFHVVLNAGGTCHRLLNEDEVEALEALDTLFALDGVAGEVQEVKAEGDRLELRITGLSDRDWAVVDKSLRLDLGQLLQSRSGDTAIYEAE